MTARATATTAEGAATSSLTALYRELYGERMPDVHRCGKRGIRVERFDSLRNPVSAAARCIHYEKANGIDNEPNPKEN